MLTNLIGKVGDQINLYLIYKIREYLMTTEKQIHVFLDGDNDQFMFRLETYSHNSPFDITRTIAIHNPKNQGDIYNKLSELSDNDVVFIDSVCVALDANAQNTLRNYKCDVYSSVYLGQLPLKQINPENVIKQLLSIDKVENAEMQRLRNSDVTNILVMTCDDSLYWKGVNSQDYGSEYVFQFYRLTHKTEISLLVENDNLKNLIADQMINEKFIGRRVKVKIETID